MIIFLTNDDGIEAPGMAILEDMLTAAGHEVWMCAPLFDKSSTSHSLSDTRGKHLHQRAPRKYSFDGSPADCVMHALGQKKLPVSPDLVVCGINQGFNLSLDILYSGTCGAASEAASWGYKAIALSTQKTDDDRSDIPLAAQFLLAHLEEFHALLTPNFYLNINVPYGSDGSSWEIGTEMYLAHRCSGYSVDQSFLHNGREALRSGFAHADLAICLEDTICVSPIMIAPGIWHDAIAPLTEILRLSI